MSQIEQTYIMIKPDGVQRGLVGKIVKRFEEKGFSLVAMKMMQPPKEHLEEHYKDLATKKFFPGLIAYMLRAPVVCMVWQGLNAVKTGRVMLGATNPADSLPGTIRGDMCIEVGCNICHGSDAVESAQDEIKLWFPEGLAQYANHSLSWLYERPAEAPVASGTPFSEEKVPFKQSEEAQLECTYIMIKPDGVQRNLVGKIIERFETKGFTLLALKEAKPTKEHLEEHYKDLSTKKFFPGLIEYMQKAPVICMVWQGLNAVKTGRVMLGATNPADSAPGTIRGDMCIEVGMNICHGSDAVESAQDEINLWFPEGICSWSSHSNSWLYEKPVAA